MRSSYSHNSWWLHSQIVPNSLESRWPTTTRLEIIIEYIFSFLITLQYYIKINTRKWNKTSSIPSTWSWNVLIWLGCTGKREFNSIPFIRSRLWYLVGERSWKYLFKISHVFESRRIRILGFLMASNRRDRCTNNDRFRFDENKSNSIALHWSFTRFVISCFYCCWFKLDWLVLKKIFFASGTTSFFVMGSLHPEMNAKIRTMHALGMKFLFINF